MVIFRPCTPAEWAGQHVEVEFRFDLAAVGVWPVRVQRLRPVSVAKQVDANPLGLAFVGGARCVVLIRLVGWLVVTGRKDALRRHLLVPDAVVARTATVVNRVVADASACNGSRSICEIAHRSHWPVVPSAAGGTARAVAVAVAPLVLIMAGGPPADYHLG